MDGTLYTVFGCYFVFVVVKLTANMRELRKLKRENPWLKELQ